MINPPPSGLTRDEGMARIRLIRSAGVGATGFRHLLARFGSARAAVEALPDLAAQGALRRSKAPYRAFTLEAVEAEMLAVRAAGGRYVFHDSADYPALLRMIEGAPPILIVRGQVAIAQQRPVALVGARNASAGAVKIARDLGHELATHGCAVISGLARGVDAAAHEGALAAQGAGTVAVIAGGLDVAYPPEHAALQERIAAEGLIVSEMPPGVQPTQRHFPARNRIIAALSLGTVVVEGAFRSGSLITAGLAGDYGREVMAVPGSPLDPRSHGTNAMIRDGAVLVQRAEDILELITGFDGMARSQFRPAKSREDSVDLFTREQAAIDDTQPPPQETPPAVAERVAALLGMAPVSVGELIRQSGASTAEVQAALIDMELTGAIQRHAGGKVSLVA